MRRAGLVAALAFALAATPSPGRADPFESHQEARLLNCVGRAGEDANALRRCLGASARPCIAIEGGATMSHVLCWSHEADSWSALLQREISELNAEQSYRDPQRLVRANAAWEAWVEAECDYWAWQEGGGSGEQVDRAECAARLTAERAISFMSAAR